MQEKQGRSNISLRGLTCTATSTWSSPVAGADVYWKIQSSGDSGLGGGGVLIGTMYATHSSANIRFHLSNSSVTGVLDSAGAVTFGNSTTVNFCRTRCPAP